MSENKATFAGFWIRVLSTIMDEILVMLATWPIGAVFLGWVDASPFSQQIWMLCFYAVVASIYYTIGHHRWGTTLGKYPFKIYVVDAVTLKPPGMGKSALRTLGYFLSSALMGIGYLMAVFHPKKQALHDLMANTLALNIPSRSFK